jgi:hypothetical protein
VLTNRDQWPSHIQERYPKQGKPWFLYFVGLIFIAVIGSFVAVGINRVINPPIYEKLLAWEIKDENNVEVIFEVRRNENIDVWCLIRAQNENMTDVGYAILEILKDGKNYKQINYNLKTYENAYTAEVINCDDEKESTLFTAPQFVPGVEIPKQDPPAINSGQ